MESHPSVGLPNGFYVHSKGSRFTQWSLSLVQAYEMESRSTQ